MDEEERCHVCDKLIAPPFYSIGFRKACSRKCVNKYRESEGFPSVSDAEFDEMDKRQRD